MKTTFTTAITVFLFILTGCKEHADSKPGSDPLSNAFRRDMQPADSPAGDSRSKTYFINFDKDTTGILPASWTQAFTGRGNTRWKIADLGNGNHAMWQSYGKNPGGHFNIVVQDSIRMRNGRLEVRIKALSGRHDRGGGLIWRYAGKNNYYVVRLNPLEDNVVLYKVEKGRRTDLPLLGKGRTYGMDVPPLGDGWNSLAVEVKDDVFSVFLNGKMLYEVQDGTFSGSGKTGFWTKADAVSYFDDFSIRIDP